MTTEKGRIGWEVGRRFKRQGTYVYLSLTHADMWQKPTQYCKAIILQLKRNCFKRYYWIKKKKICHHQNYPKTTANGNLLERKKNTKERILKHQEERKM